ncbi:RNA-binding protein 8A-like protein [Spinellus fusiger]|nr:RNA-binding protein 8A-like protein [Spinellus fusiger]
MLTDRDSRSRRDHSNDRMAIDEERPTEIKQKGRLFSSKDNDRRSLRSNRMEDEGSLEPERSVEGWIIIVRGVHEEADEEGLTERFSDYGTIKHLHLNLDRQSGYGYALIEYEAFKEAEKAVSHASGTSYLGQTINVSFAFVKGPEKTETRRFTSSRSQRERSVSPNAGRR